MCYYASGGTFLGAVRHKGFIPWDDDIDVWMPRPDYERLKDILLEKDGKYVFEAPGHNCGQHYYAMGKLYDTSTTIIELTKFNAKKGIFVDIFPIDGLGRTKNELKKNYNKLHLLNLLVRSRVYVPQKEKKFIRNLAIHLSSIIPEALLNTEKFIEWFDKKCSKVSYDESKFVGIMMGSYGMRDVVEKRILNDRVLYDFETIKIFGVADYDTFLTHIYGDWRKLPSVEKQVTLHEFNHLDLNRGYMD